MSEQHPHMAQVEATSRADRGDVPPPWGWRPFEQTRENEEQARRERDGAADDEMFQRAAFSQAATRALTSHIGPIDARAADLRAQIAKAREQ